MRKLLSIFCLGVISLSCSRIPPGYVGIIVDTTGAEAGNTDKMVDGGTRKWIGPTQELHLFPLYKIIEKWSKSDQRLPSERNTPHIDQSITFQDSEGLQINVDIGMSFQLEKSKIPDLFKTYRTNIDTISDREIRTIVQKEFNNFGAQYKINDIYGKGKADFLDKIQNVVKDKLKPNGIILNRLSYLGPMRLPQSVKLALDEKVKVGQKTAQRRNEIAQIEAEMEKKEKQYQAEIREKKAKAKAYAEETEIKARADAKKIFLEAQARAKANEMIAKSVTKNLINYEKMKSWNGKLPTTVLGESQNLITLKSLN